MPPVFWRNDAQINKSTTFLLGVLLYRALETGLKIFSDGLWSKAAPLDTAPNSCLKSSVLPTAFQWEAFPALFAHFCVVRRPHGSCFFLQWLLPHLSHWLPALKIFFGFLLFWMSASLTSLISPGRVKPHRVAACEALCGGISSVTWVVQNVVVSQK